MQRSGNEASLRISQRGISRVEVNFDLAAINDRAAGRDKPAASGSNHVNARDRSTAASPARRGNDRILRIGVINGDVRAGLHRLQRRANDRRHGFARAQRRHERVVVGPVDCLPFGRADVITANRQCRDHPTPCDPDINHQSSSSGGISPQ